MIMRSEKQFILCQDDLGNYEIRYGDKVFHFLWEVAPILNEQQELIEELEVSDEMGWKRAEYFEKKCPKELHNKKMYIKRLEYKVQKFKEENEELKKQLEIRTASDKYHQRMLNKWLCKNE